MEPTSDLLDFFELCHRAGVYYRDYRKAKVTVHQMLMKGIFEGLVTDRPDYGQAAGEKCFDIAVKPGFQSDQHDLHAEAVHVCSLADAITTSLRHKAAWRPAPPVELGTGHLWESDAFLDPSGTCLRRVITVSQWSEERHYAACRGWGTLGTMCAYGLPVKLCVVQIGQHREGRFYSPWTRGFLHPVSRQLRFRKKGGGEGFKSSWSQVWREDRAEISTREWLQAMLDDGVLEDSVTIVEVPLPGAEAQKTIRELAIRRLDEIYDAEALPDQQLSTCFWPRRCPFLSPCHKGETPNGRYGFVKIGSDTAQS